MRRYERSWRWWVKEKKQMGFVFIAITVMMFQLLMKGSEGCLETERIGLLELKSYLNSLLLSTKDKRILKSWSDDDRSSDCCHWERVNCSDAIGGHVADLSLNEIMPLRYLSTDAPLPPPQLKTLDFQRNGFTDLFDPIHGDKSFERLENLHTLDLSDNHLNNSVLPFLSAATSLRTLNLGNNKLGGVFPPNGYKIFQKLEKLETLDLFSSGLNNNDLPFLSAARSLRTLNLGANFLEGVFPPNELANMSKLRVLKLQDNEFSFFSVKGLINLRELEVLDLSRNGINDSKAGDGLRTTKLKTLDLNFNKFSEAAQLKVLKDMPNLQELYLSWNDFTDLDSLGLVFPLSLQVLNLKGNQLSSTLKGYSEICRLMHLRELSLGSNSLTSMPNCLGNLTRLRTLDLSYNQLNGNLSSLVSHLPSALEYLSLLDNNFNSSFCFNSLVNHTRLSIFKLSSRVGTIQDMTESSWVPLFQMKMLKLHNFILGSKIPGFLLH